MSLDPRFIPLYDIQQYLVDKDTGFPLANGVLTFYRDIDRNALKDIYQISGSPPNYVYTQLPNPLTLSSVGTPINNTNQDIVIYAFPYDGDQITSTGEVDLYYLTVYSEDNVLQFTREGLPNVASGGISDVSLVNYVPNGQFLIHQNIPPTPSTILGQVTQSITYLTQGGWTFERNSGSTDTDIVNFVPYDAAISDPTGSPKYAININTTGYTPGGTFKDLRLRFNDVNKFASDDQTYTFSFNGFTGNGSPTNLDLILIKDFGEGGDPTTETLVTSFSIQISPTQYNVSFIFGTNLSNTIKPGDFIQLALRPNNGGSLAWQNVTLVDFVLTPGTVIVSSFPITTDATFVEDSIAGWADVPDYSGMNLYLPPVLTPQGMSWDDSQIGMVFADTTGYTPISYIKADGGSYLTEAYSSDGIPYRRLQLRYFNNTPIQNVPRYGTGASYLTAYIETISMIVANYLRITTNTSGLVSPAFIDGSIPTGFDFSNIHDGMSTNFTAYFAAFTPTIDVYLNQKGAIAFPGYIDPGTVTGMTASIIRNIDNGYSIVEYSFPAVSIGLAGTYFTISDTTTRYYMWFTVDATGTDPAPPGLTSLGVVNLLSNYTDVDFANIVREALNGYQQTSIIVNDGSTITAGSWFGINTFTTKYYVYYIVDGVGSNPNPSGYTLIGAVEIASSDTDNSVAYDTQGTINSYSFAVPNFRGLMLRGEDPDGRFDINYQNRLNVISYGGVNALGSIEYDTYGEHDHVGKIVFETATYFTQNAASLVKDVNAGSIYGEATFPPGNNVEVFANGYGETVPVNVSVNWIIKY